MRIAIVLALAAAVVWAARSAQRTETASSTQAHPAGTAPAQTGESPGAEPVLLPRLLEIGGGKHCAPCKLMKPTLAALRREYAGRLRIDVVYTDDDPEAGERYHIMLIPSHIFLDPSGKELARIEGEVISKQDILAKWRELGYDLTPSRPREAGPRPQRPAHKPGEQAAAADEPAPDVADEQPPLLTRLFQALTRLVRGAPAVALGASFLWGILSVLLSPCHLSSIPLIVGFIDAQGRTTARRAFATSSLFAGGILITIGIIGGITAAAGRMLGSVGAWANYFVAAIFLLVALVLLDVLPMPWSGPGQVGMKRRGPLAAFILGLVFGVALGPCTFAYMAPMLGVTFKVASASLAYGVLLLAAYGIGHCSVIVAAGTSTELVQRYLNWNERSKGAVVVKRLCGALVAVGGIYLIHTAR